MSSAIPTQPIPTVEAAKGMLPVINPSVIPIPALPMDLPLLAQVMYCLLRELENDLTY